MSIDDDTTTPSTATPAAGRSVDFALVRRLRTTVAERMSTERRQRADSGQAEMGEQDELLFAESLINRALAEEKQSRLSIGRSLDDDEDALRSAVSSAIFGLGRLQPLIERHDLSDININGCDEVWLKTLDGRKSRGPAVADSDEELIQWVRDTATYHGLTSRPFDPANPYLEMRLPDRSRLTALMSVSERPSVCIRLFRMRTVRLADLHARGMFTDHVGAFITAAVKARKNILIAGETGSGKTTVLRALANEIPPTERIITIEHFLELGLPKDLHPDMQELEERPANAEGQGAVTPEELVRRTRRMDPDRVILGECVGPEVVALLDAFTQGNDGGLSTIHGSTARSAIDKIALYAAQAETPLPQRAADMLTAIGLDLIIHVKKTRQPDGTTRRHISSILEVQHYDGVQVVTSEIFRAPTGTLDALPKAPLTDDLRESLLDAGYDDREWQDLR